MADSSVRANRKISARCLWQEAWSKWLWARPESADHFLQLLFSPTGSFAGNRDSCVRSEAGNRRQESFFCNTLADEKIILQPGPTSSCASPLSRYFFD